MKHENLGGQRYWLLERDRYYDQTEVIGLIVDELEAWQIACAVEHSDEYSVSEVPTLAGVTVETLWSQVSCSFTIKWDGATGGGRIGEPVDTVVLRGIPGLSDEDQHAGDPPPECEVEIRAMESGYKLGVSLRVWGSDLDRVRAEYERLRDGLIADPAGATIEAWVRSDWLPRWTFGRIENHALLPALANALVLAGKGALVESHVDRGS